MDTLNDIISGLKWGDLDPVEAHDRVLALFSVSGSYLPKCTRVEVIDKSGRAYTNYDCKSVETQMQDEERTLKVFIS